MAAHDWMLPARSPLCLPADALYRTGQAIIHNLSGAVTPDMVAAAQEALATYRAELLPTLHPMHFGVSVGIHICVEDVYQEARARLRGLAATMQPIPESPAPPPAPQQQPITADEVVNNLRTLANELKRPRDTYLGTDEPPAHPGSTT
jgi:alkanesulfonate monooxygenase SsuD/methylene tetrahydromethanopterin reductase-like flavin-dependent oxidoreductase (luciferase family)